MDPPAPADRKARAILAKMEERDDKQTVEVAFHPPDKSSTDELHHPPYAVAPTPASGERARDAAADVAAPDMHTLTVADLVAAVSQRLDEMDVDPDAKAGARRWLERAERALAADGAQSGEPGGGEVGVLVHAVQSTLGLADQPGALSRSSARQSD
jgi:hypothetical protein